MKLLCIPLLFWAVIVAAQTPEYKYSLGTTGGPINNFATDFNAGLLFSYHHSVRFSFGFQPNLSYITANSTPNAILDSTSLIDEGGYKDIAMRIVAPVYVDFHNKTRFKYHAYFGAFASYLIYYHRKYTKPFELDKNMYNTTNGYRFNYGINPGVGLSYKIGRWDLLAQLFYYVGFKKENHIITNSYLAANGGITYSFN